MLIVVGIVVSLRLNAHYERVVEVTLRVPLANVEAHTALLDRLIFDITVLAIMPEITLTLMAYSRLLKRVVVDTDNSEDRVTLH